MALLVGEAAGYEHPVFGSFAAHAIHKRQHRRLLSSVREWVADEAEDVAIGHRWRSVWPTLSGIVVLLLGAVLGSEDRVWIVALALFFGFGLLAAGWLLTPATLIVTTADAVFVLRGRRRTYEPIALEERVERSSWRTGDEIRKRSLWVPGFWKKHLP